MQAAATRVLVVDDEPLDASLVRRSLRAHAGGADRFEVRHAATLAQGLEQLQRDPVDVLLLDLGLPDSDGTDTIVRLRDRDPCVPLVVFTGNDDEELAARAFEAGADEYLVKSDLDAGVLRRTLRHAIERRRLSLQGALAVPTQARISPQDARRLLHDLRNLHTLILGNAQILRDDAAEHPGLRSRAEALMRAARLAGELAEQILDRPASGRAPAGTVELSDFVRGAVPLLRAVVPERIQLRLDLWPRLLLASVGVERLFSALLELVVNAVEAIGDADGSLELRTGEAVLGDLPTTGLIAPRGVDAGPYVWLEVRDTGRGFDLASVGALMASGFSTKGSGHGYGLSHLGDMLAEYRAALFVESRVGEGASFRILFRGE